MNYLSNWVEIDLSALAQNIVAHQKWIADDAELMAVVKADAYGHGAVPVMEIAIQEGIKWAGVALIEEAIELRESGIGIPILLLGGWLKETTEAFFLYNVVPCVYSLESAGWLNEEAKKTGRSIQVHLKVETGMGRLGFSEKQLERFVELCDSEFQYLQIDGFASHLSSADAKDTSFSLSQIKRFHHLLEMVRKKFQPKWIHLSNSAGISQIVEERGNLFRLGISMYGQPPSTERTNFPPLREALSWKSTVVHLQRYPKGYPISYGRTVELKRDSKIATVRAGYADGYNRSLSNKGVVLINGCRVPIVGRVCMDMMMVDVTSIDGVALGDEVVLIGSQGKERITATEMANWVGTINYEITCAISKRVPRLYS